MFNRKVTTWSMSKRLLSLSVFSVRFACVRSSVVFFFFFFSAFSFLSLFFLPNEVSLAGWDHVDD